MSNNKEWNQIEKLIEAGKSAEALDLIEKLMPKAKNPEQLINAKAVAFMLQGKYEGAESELINAYMIPQSPENMDRLYNLIAIYKQNGKDLHSESVKYLYASLADDYESKEYINDLKARTINKEDIILEQKNNTVQDYIELVNLYAIQSYNFEVAYILSVTGIKHEEIDASGGLKPHFDCAKDKNSIYIVVESKNQPTSEVFLNALMKLSEKVYFIKQPIDIETEGINFLEEDLISLSLKNETEHGNLSILTPALLIDQNIGNKLDTTGRLLSYIAKQNQDKKCMLFINNNKFNSLDYASPIASIYINRNYNDQRYVSEDMFLYRIGEYVNMYSELYGFDIKKALESSAEVKISIVIPTRNCPETLRYTLMSCLDQTYEDYEIVLSDNGDPGDDEIYALAEEMNAKCIAEGREPKIKYYHTPGPLSLPKSFEFAYLHARGEFIFGLGSDDAVMPDALKVLARIIDENPNDDVILWNRNTYFWPNSSPNQRNQLIYSMKGANGQYETVRLPNAQFFNLVLTGQLAIYGMPMCYINSGMRRRYINKIIDKTGTFIGGAGQDIYMGILNLYLNREVVFAICPITIAALSGKSIGGMNLYGVRSQEDRKKQIIEWQKTLNITEAETKSQKLAPMTNWDMTVFYNQLLRVQDLGVGRIAGDDNINFKTLFEQAILQFSPIDLNNPMYVNNLLDAARLHGDSFYEWFKPLADEFMKLRTKYRLAFEQLLENGEQIYKENENPDGGGNVILDASKYGITNVYEAAKLIEKRIKSM